MGAKFSEFGADVGEAIVVRETPLALLVKLVDHNNREAWVPKSAIHDDSEVYEDGTEGILILEPWLAKKLELV